MYSLTLWLGIPGERRIWLEQWEGIPLILKNLSRYFPSIKVYVDGMTAYDGERIEVKNNLEAFWKIVENTKEAFEVGDSRHCEEQGDEAIHNQAYFKDSIAESRIDKMMDCHDSVSQNLAMTEKLNSNESDIMDCHAENKARNDNPCASLRGASETSNEAIHNQAKSNFNNGITNGETKDYGFAQCGQTATQCAPRSLTTSRNDRGDSQNSCTIYGAKGEKITLKSLSGYDYRTKICYCAMCDIAISEIATTALVPFIFCKKGGVAFQSFTADIIPKIKHLKIIKNNDIKKIKVGVGGLIYDFHIPPEHIYNLAAESLEELSIEGKLASFSKDNPLKIHRLNVPPVELYAKKHALEQKTKIKINSNPSTKRLLKEISYQKQLLEIESLELDIQLKQIQIKSSGGIPPSPTPNTAMQGSAKDRIHNHLAYKLGAALILNSKSLWGYIRMPYVLSYIKESHRKEITDYEARVAKNPSLKLPKLESYPDYKEALREKECLTYKLGEALMQADKDWYKGGYLRFYFLDVPRLKREFRERKK